MTLPLNDRQRAFARHYVECGNAAEAARRAGYSKGSAKQRAYDNLRNPAILAEIERLQSRFKQALALTFGQRKQDAPLEGDILPPSPEELEQAEEDALILSRAFVVTRLMRNAQLCMGEIKATTTRVLKSRRQDGTEEMTAVQVEAFERDAAGANRALELLAAELNRLEGKGDTPLPEGENTKAISHNPELAAALDRFNEVARARGIKIKGMNGHANGNGAAANGQEH